MVFESVEPDVKELGRMGYGTHDDPLIKVIAERIALATRVGCSGAVIRAIQQSQDAYCGIIPILNQKCYDLAAEVMQLKMDQEPDIDEIIHRNFCQILWDKFLEKYFQDNPHAQWIAVVGPLESPKVVAYSEEINIWLSTDDRRQLSEDNGGLIVFSWFRSQQC